MKHVQFQNYRGISDNESDYKTAQPKRLNPLKNPLPYMPKPICYKYNAASQRFPGPSPSYRIPLVITRQHMRRLVALVLILSHQLLLIRDIGGRRPHPVARHDTRERDPDPRRPVQPPRPAPARQLLDEPRRKVVAVQRQDVVRGAEELGGDVADSGVDLGLRGEGEAVDQLALEERAGWDLAGLGPVDARDAGAAVASIGVFFAVYDDAGV